MEAEADPASSSSNDTFLGERDFDNTGSTNKGIDVNLLSEPVEVIVSRVIFALLVSVSIVMNLLLLLAVLRRRRTIQVAYMLTATMLIPDLVFYCKLVTELVNWNDPQPTWAANKWACGLWQFSSHVYPLLYMALLTAITYHVFLTLFLDYSGAYEEHSKKFFFAIVTVVIVTCSFIAAPSAFFAATKQDASDGISTSSPLNSVTQFRQYCDLEVPALITPWASLTVDMKAESSAAFRLVYDLVLPFLLPLLLLGFPYVALLIGLMRSLPAASHADYPTKLSVVVTLWLITSYFMLHVATVLHNVFSVFSIWHRLMTLFDAEDDIRVPRYQAYIHVLSYMLTCVWGIVRPSLCFKYNHKLRKALGT